ncbi:MAG: hypothetical protein M3O61_02000 [Gemmatimonadota bacterium]|nr:hypothetical protein [Gemmatimonadota bacterium]
MRIRSTGRLELSGMTIAAVSTWIGLEVQAALTATNAPATALLIEPLARIPMG